MIVTSPVHQLYWLTYTTHRVQLTVVCYLNITSLGKILRVFLIDFTTYLSVFEYVLVIRHRIKAWDPFEHQQTIYPVYEVVHYTVIIKLQLLEEKAKAILLAGT